MRAKSRTTARIRKSFIGFSVSPAPAGWVWRGSMEDSRDAPPAVPAPPSLHPGKQRLAPRGGQPLLRGAAVAEEGFGFARRAASRAADRLRRETSGDKPRTDAGREIETPPAWSIGSDARIRERCHDLGANLETAGANAGADPGRAAGGERARVPRHLLQQRGKQPCGYPAPAAVRDADHSGASIPHRDREAVGD